VLGKVGPYAVSLLVAAAGYLVFDRFDVLETFQAQTEARVQQLEYRVGSTSESGTIQKDIEDLWVFTHSLNTSYRNLSTELLIRNNLGGAGLDVQPDDPQFSNPSGNPVVFVDPDLYDWKSLGIKPNDVFADEYFGCDSDKFVAVCNDVYGGAGEWR
jgi:hypothetical protein